MGDAHYTCFAYDEETDLRRVPYWVFGAAETPPGHPRTPMFDWLFMNGSHWGASYACDRLCIPSVKALAFRSYHGYLFTSVIVPQSDEEVRGRKDRFRIAIRHLIENYDRIWSETKTKLLRHVEKPKRFDFDRASWFEMSQLFRERIDAEREMYEIYYYLAAGLGAIYANFERTCCNMLGIGEADPLFQKLLAGFDNDSYQVDRGLYQLARRADELGLREILLRNAPEDVLPKMEGIEGGRQWVAELKGFLDVHGWRSPLEMEYLSPSWAEKPSQAIGHLQRCLEAEGVLALDDILSRQARERMEAEETLMARVPAGQRDWFRAFMKIAQGYTVWNVEHAYYCQMAQYSMTRFVLMGIGKRISEAGCIQEPEDTLFLIPEEVHKILSAAESTDLMPTVKMRREAWERSRDILPPPLMARISPEEVARIVLRSKDPLTARLVTGRMVSASEEGKADLVGDLLSPGVGEGPARVVRSADQLGEVREGEILVAPAIWSSWSPVFSLVRGIVADRGGIVSSAASVGREYGIPVVANVIEGTSMIQTGQRVRVDGNMGTVHIVDSLHGKRVLVVDDEPDILEVLEDLLPMCDVVKASTFQEAKGLLEKESFDMAILDIMGVDGYALLEMAKQKQVLPIMLTAHALTLEDTVKSYKQGAAYYVPKDEMGQIVTILNDVLRGRKEGMRFWWHWFERFGPMYEKMFGPDWQNQYPEFWEMFQDEAFLEAGGKRERK